MIGWDDLVALEPRLADLEIEVASVDDHDRPSFCANQAWYGGPAGLKGKLCQLVGWERRSDEREQFGEEWDREHGKGAWKIYSGSELFARADAEEPYLWAAKAEDEAAGKGALWGDDAYDVAYEHLYELLPDCRNCGCL